MNQNPQKNPKKLYVGNLSWALTENEVRELCEPFGEVTYLKLITDENGRSRGFAFVEFATEEAAQKALELNEQEVDGRALSVSVARPRKPRRRFNRGGRNNYQNSNNSQSF
ncbi:MAG: RNA-binding protein [Candidatus Pacebacteria bacterium]|nr:RNA-binding protein [Candidatus Paceibacterota bacterium]